MLKVQEYLRNGNTLDDLTNTLGIRIAAHPTLPLVIINYDQIESPKTNPIVRECRGLVLRNDTFDIVAKAFNRFFNWGEVQDEMGLFDFSDFIVQSKEDGSLCLIYYFDGAWRANTRGSFAMDKMQFFEFTWQEAFCVALGIQNLQELDSKLDKSVCYVCEFCSPYNKIVRRYEKSVMYLLAAFRGADEVHYNEVDQLASGTFLRPNRYEFTSVEQIQTFLQDQSATDPTFEGVVICDKNGTSWKIKSATYLGFHRLRGEGDNLFNPKHLIPFILAGESDELLTYFEECRPAYEKYEKILNDWKAEMNVLWDSAKNEVSQKDFAMKVKDHKLSSVLFTARKTNRSPNEIFKGSADLLTKLVKYDPTETILLA